MLALSGPATLSLGESVTEISGGNVTAANVGSAFQQVQGKNIGQVATGLAASFLASPVGPLIAGFLAVLGFARGKTERASGTDATRIANELAPGIYNRIRAAATPAQLAYMSEHLPGIVIDFIVKSDWWNEREADNIATSMALHRTFVNTPGGSDIKNPWRIERSIWELIHWAAKNSPKDMALFQEHLQQIFSQTVGRDMQQAYAVYPGESSGVVVASPLQAGFGGTSSGVVIGGTVLLIGALVGILKWVK